MNLWTLLERAARSHPAKLAIVDGELRCDYATLRASAAALAAGLARLGVGTGDRVAILEPNSALFLQSYFAAAGLGAILVPLNTRLSAPELVAILGHCGARMLLAHGSLRGVVGELRKLRDEPLTIVWSSEDSTSLQDGERRTEDLLREGCADFRALEVTDEHVAQLYYTSGTTGEPKGVMLTHGNVAWHALGARAELALSDAEVWIHVAPMFHLADAWASFAITWCAGTHVFCPKFDERAVLDLFVRERVTLTNLVPTMLQRLVAFDGAASRDYSSLRMILSGGAPIAPSVVRRIVEVFRCEYVQTYGMTETSPYLTLSLLKQHLRAAPPEVQFAYRAKTGRAFATVDLEVIGEDGRSVAADGIAVGEIRARGATVTPGYWNDPEATRRAFVDGWLLTGDLATIDAEGYLQIVDRKKDMIISGGEKVYSTEVEHVFYAHPAVLECAVFGMADETWGERVEAAVVLRAGESCTAGQLIAHARQQLAGFKVPRRIRFLSELPKTGTGKIAKRWLREHAARED